MAYPIDFKNMATELRVNGSSLNEIYQKLGVSKSILSRWLRSVEVSKEGKENLFRKIKKGQFISAQNKKERTRSGIDKLFKSAQQDVAKTQFSREQLKILCALLYWCEGGKTDKDGVRFTNSDPRLIRTFLRIFRLSFNLEESKFRICLHLHDYHIDDVQKEFWMRVTSISESQFLKSFRRKNTGKRIRDDYNGCASVRYPSVSVARELLALGKAFVFQFGGIG